MLERFDFGFRILDFGLIILGNNLAHSAIPNPLSDYSVISRALNGITYQNFEDGKENGKAACYRRCRSCAFDHFEKFTDRFENLFFFQTILKHLQTNLKNRFVPTDLKMYRPF